MSKSLSIQSLTRLITTICVVLIVLLIAVFYFFHFEENTLTFAVVFIILGIIVVHLAVSLLLKKFVTEKLALIYNFIHDARLKNSALKKEKLNVTSIEDVKSDVIKWAEDTEKQIQSLRSLEQYRKNFVGNVSHELKTPIFSIQGYLHTLIEGGVYDDMINMKYLERAAENADRLQNIVEDLEGIAKLESGKLALDLQEFDLKALVSEVFQDFGITASENNISLGFKAGGDSSFKVSCDPSMIRQVFVNLLNNSIKYGKDEGRTEIGFYDMGGNVLVEVSDNGIGIESKHLNHLFDRFYRVDPSRSRMLGGSGLGLSIVKHIIEAHQQTIKVTSTPGEGSTFSFTLEKA
ncbi:MAG: ATP-binding protein [Bacteroidota bacterium]